MSVRFVDLDAQFATIESEVRAAIDDVLASKRFVMGPHLSAFEGDFASFIGTDHAVGVSNGTEALWLGLMALDIGPGDEVIVPANTYIASAFAVSAVGAKPVLVDCDPQTLQIDAHLASVAVTERTRAIMPVHFAGGAAPMDTLLEVARRHGLKVVEDAAQAHGTHFKGRTCGAFGDVGCFSFYPGKNLGAYGDGGAVTTNDADVAKRLMRLRDFGQDKKYEHLEWGWNARLDEIQAAVLGVKLARLPEWNAARRAAAARYQELLADVSGITFQTHVDASVPTYHLFITHVEGRDGLAAALAKAQIETVMHYPTPLHLQPAYASLGYRAGAFPNAEAHSRTTLSLPLYPEITADDQAVVARAVHNHFAEATT